MVNQTIPLTYFNFREIVPQLVYPFMNPLFESSPIFPVITISDFFFSGERFGQFLRFRPKVFRMMEV